MKSKLRRMKSKLRRSIRTASGDIPTGYVIYKGPSRIDGSPIVIILIEKSGNTKTGNMLQTYIIRSDMNPLAAVDSGADISICSNCPHRGGIVDILTGIITERTCYVNLGQGPLSVFNAYTRGNYPQLSVHHPIIQEMVQDRMVRLGTYGDPYAAPMGYWNALLTNAKSWTGYTHQWRTAPDLKHLCMASCDCESDFQLAQSMGWRTFRVRLEDSMLFEREIDCPASKQSGYRTTCERCRLCKGDSIKAKSVSIPMHGSAAHIKRSKVLLPILEMQSCRS